MAKKMRGKHNKSTDEFDKLYQEFRPKGKKEKIRVATAGYYASGYGLEQSKILAKARIAKQYPKHKK